MALFQIRKLLDDKYLSFIMTNFLLKVGPKSSQQPGTVLFSDGWWGINVGVLNYDTFSTAKSSKTAENHSKINKLDTSTYLDSKWQQLCLASVLDYSLAQRKNTHVPGVRFVQPWTTANFFQYICIRKHCTTHPPPLFKIQDPPGKNATFWFAGPAKIFKPCMQSRATAVWWPQ